MKVYKDGTEYMASVLGWSNDFFQEDNPLEAMKEVYDEEVDVSAKVQRVMQEQEEGVKLWTLKPKDSNYEVVTNEEYRSLQP
jgi:hypothetical protein